MNLKKICIFTTVVLGISASASMALADGKVYPGAACLPYSSANQDILQRFGDVTNTSQNNSLLVICPVVKDLVGGTRLDYIRVTYTKESNTGLSCSIYGMNSSGTGATGTYTSSFWDFAGPGTKNRVLADIDGYSSGAYFLYCIIPPEGSIQSYRVDEQ
ncbi:MAG: hypothetical protein KTR25_02675 [Myxococcales bacterium]|nr:hypothetical protein [Myxococcales bacterium]